jgi:hypothetical protein
MKVRKFGRAGIDVGLVIKLLGSRNGDGHEARPPHGNDMRRFR